MSVNDDFTKDTDKRFTLRMDAQLFEKISDLAQKHRRSVAKEIEEAVARYVDSFDDINI